MTCTADISEGMNQGCAEGTDSVKMVVIDQAGNTMLFSMYEFGLFETAAKAEDKEALDKLKKIGIDRVKNAGIKIINTGGEG